MSKRNVTYIKPEEPSFLRKLKAEVGYKAADTVDTKVSTVLSHYDFWFVSSIKGHCQQSLKENKAY
jgi:hypothetical protein